MARIVVPQYFGAPRFAEPGLSSRWQSASLSGLIASNASTVVRSPFETAALEGIKLDTVRYKRSDKRSSD